MFRLFKYPTSIFLTGQYQPVHKFSFENLVEYLLGKKQLTTVNIYQILFDNFKFAASGWGRLIIHDRLQRIITLYLANNKIFSDNNEILDLSESTIGYFNLETLEKLDIILKMCKPLSLNLAYNDIDAMSELEFQFLSEILISLNIQSLTVSDYEISLLASKQFCMFLQILASGITKLTIHKANDRGISDDDLKLIYDIIKINVEIKAINTERNNSLVNIAASFYVRNKDICTKKELPKACHKAIKAQEAIEAHLQDLVAHRNKLTIS